MKPILFSEVLDFTKRALAVVVAEDLTQAIACYNEEFKNPLDIPKGIASCTGLCIVEPNGACILLFKYDKLCASLICHEVTHATNAMLSHIGVQKVTNSTDEVFAYHNDMLFRKVAEFLLEHGVAVPLVPTK